MALAVQPPKVLAPIPATPPVVIKDFATRVNAYVNLRKDVEDSFSSLTTSKDAAELAAYKIELTAMVISARHNARQGDIFTPDMAFQFRDIIRKAFLGPGGQAVRTTARDKDSVKPFVMRVNVAYPEEIEIQTTPPTLLAHLPQLPMGLAYRIIGRAFVLFDNKTNLIVDFLPNAVP